MCPKLSAAVADISHPDWRGSAIGIYRFWRDLGYGICGLGLGLGIVAHSTGQMETAFWFVALSMFASGGLLWWLGGRNASKAESSALKPACSPRRPASFREGLKVYFRSEKYL